MSEARQSIPKGWKETTLGEVADVNAATINGDYPHDEIEYIDVASVEERKLVNTQILQLKEAPSRAKRIVRDNDILISTVRPNLKHYCFIKKSKPNLVASTGFAVVSAKSTDAYFLYNLLTTNEYTDYLIKIADSQTSTYPAFNPGVISNSKFIFPPLPEQRAIAGVLSSLDDKIELLREQNKTLETTAQAIFKRWFVDVEFPDAKGHPYKSSGGKMQASSLGPIPTGWQIGELGKVTDIRGGTTPSTTNPDFWNGDIAWTSPKDLSNSKDIFLLKTEKTISESGLAEIGSGLLPAGTLLLSSRAPIGYLTIADISVAINQGYIACMPGQYFSNPFMFLWLKQNMQDVINAANGSTFMEISKSSFRLINAIVPQDMVLNKFEAIAAPIFEKIRIDTYQIQTLSALRDTLLPKLMKGELRVQNYAS